MCQLVLLLVCTKSTLFSWFGLIAKFVSTSPCTLQHFSLYRLCVFCVWLWMLVVLSFSCSQWLLLTTERERERERERMDCSVCLQNFLPLFPGCPLLSLSLPPLVHTTYALFSRTSVCVRPCVRACVRARVHVSGATFVSSLLVCLLPCLFDNLLFSFLQCNLIDV